MLKMKDKIVKKLDINNEATQGNEFLILKN